MKTHYSLNSFIPGLNIRLQILCFSDRFLRVTRISYPHLRCILSAENPDNSHSPKAKNLPQFHKKQKKSLMAKAAVLGQFFATVLFVSEYQYRIRPDIRQ